MGQLCNQGMVAAGQWGAVLLAIAMVACGPGDTFSDEETNFAAEETALTDGEPGDEGLAPDQVNLIQPDPAFQDCPAFPPGTD